MRLLKCDWNKKGNIVFLVHFNKNDRFEICKRCFEGKVRTLMCQVKILLILIDQGHRYS